MLIPVVDDELRREAAHNRRDEPAADTLQLPGPVHEVCTRLCRPSP